MRVAIGYEGPLHRVPLHFSNVPDTTGLKVDLVAIEPAVLDEHRVATGHAAARDDHAWSTDVGDNDRTAFILSAFMIITFGFFTAGIIALAFWSFN